MNAQLYDNYPSRTLAERARQAWQHSDWLYRALLWLAALFVMILVFGIGYQLWRNSALSRQAFGWKVIITSDWDPALSDTFGALPFILGTLITSAIALLVAVPLGLGAALFLAEVAPSWLRGPLGFLVELF